MTVIAATGHFHPLVPLAQGLQAAGHEVVVATAPSFAAQVAACGFRYLPAGIDSRQVQEADPRLRALPPLVLRETYRRRVFPEVLPRRLLPDLLDLGRGWAPDLVVSDNYEFAGRIAAEYWGIPHASVRVGDVYGYPERASLVPQLDALRATVGLPPDPDASMLFRYLYFVCDPPQLRSAGMILPPTAHEVRLIFDRSGDEGLPGWVAGLPARPTVYATLGTALNHTPKLIEAILEDLRAEPLTLILTVGRDRDPAEFGAQPANVHIERYIPQSLILPRCHVVVSHCGSGTMRAALDAGLPLVNVPIAADQPENAARCDAVGVSFTVGVSEYTPGAIRAAVRTVLAEPRYRERAQEIRAAMRAMPGSEHAVALLERLARERQPVVGRATAAGASRAREGRS
jgi:UDP:flavonoid glycosyltransferase YjiC (YdhE family)